MLDGLGVCVLTSQEKWVKMKGIMTKWKTALDASSPRLNHRELLADRGFLVYVTRTYPAMIPYLKGFHLMIEMWQGGRDAKGWKLKCSDDSSINSNLELSKSETRDYLGEVDEDGEVDDDEDATIGHLPTTRGLAQAYAPADGVTTPVPRLRGDILALLHLTNFDLPPLRVVRPANVVHVYYGFGDASGKQFGAIVSEDYNC